MAQSVIPTTGKAGVEGFPVQGQSGLQREVQDETLTENAKQKEGLGTAFGALPNLCKALVLFPGSGLKKTRKVLWC